MARKCSARDRSLSFGCHRIFVDGPHATAVRPGSRQEAVMHRKMGSLLPLLLVALTGYAQTVGATTYSLLRSYSYPATVSLGRSVAAVGDAIVGGATYQANTEEGAVYVFDRATGALLRHLGPPQPANDFGISVASLGSDRRVGASYA